MLIIELYGLPEIDIGKVSFKLKELIDECGISRYRLAQMTETRFEVIGRLCDGECHRVDLRVIARICYVLKCSISDIIIYEPPIRKKESN